MNNELVKAEKTNQILKHQHVSFFLLESLNNKFRINFKRIIRN